MKHITLIISLTLAVFSFGSCITVDDLRPENPYEQPEDRPNGSEQDKPLASSATDLASAGKTANCYIVSSAGTYKFKPLKGNSSTSVGSVSSVEVLWESFGTSQKPSVGDLIRSVNYDAGFIVFSTPSSFKEGNAVIAAKDASGEILWSWHIWLTDQPKEQVYYNNAGTMMDRNLGATSSTPGDVGALGLLYQWGRKDPFLGSSSISDEVEAKSTVTWPSSVTASTSKGNVDYATANPMTFILGTESSEYDWYYSSRNNDLWTSSKTIYDPCPAGWRVPDGGEYGVWSKACDSSSSFDYQYDGTDEGMNFSGKFGSTSVIWYPVSGNRNDTDGALTNSSHGSCWSASTDDNDAYRLYFNDNGSVKPSSSHSRADGRAVRCLQEGPSSETPSDPVTPTYENLSASGTANSYIVSESGDYKFKTVKGNSTSTVGNVASAAVLWESFGTDVTPTVGDIVKNVSYSDGYICFSTPSSFKEGNAVIAAKDASGEILWSWHIWLTDQPQGQVYYNNAGIMMDRNLGATSATPGDVGALGLLYQWGRKDPFLGSSSISDEVEAKSTVTWPSSVTASTSKGNVDYATANPMTFILGTESSEYDWYYSSRNNDLWTSSKTIYDPCPAGWRVPDGGEYGVWSKACDSSSSFDYQYDGTDEGMNFSGKFGSASVIWYPASGGRGLNDGSLINVGDYGYYWSVAPEGDYAYSLGFAYNGNVYPSNSNYRAVGEAVRCLQE